MTTLSAWRIAEAHFHNMMKRDEFTVTEQHLKLLSYAYVDWNDLEFGAPSIDCKRPYGNSDVLRDIAERLDEGPVLGPHTDEHEAWEAWLEEHAERLAKTHAEAGVALQIALATQCFEPGDYVKGFRYDGTSWRRAS